MRRLVRVQPLREGHGREQRRDVRLGSERLDDIHLSRKQHGDFQLLRARLDHGDRGRK